MSKKKDQEGERGEGVRGEGERGEGVHGGGGGGGGGGCSCHETLNIHSITAVVYIKFQNFRTSFHMR